MSNSPTLDTLAVVSPRFARSVSLVRDVHRTDALDGYILTPVGRDVLRRLTDALQGDSPTRAWSLTGPYGSGKSALTMTTTPYRESFSYSEASNRSPHSVSSCRKSTI